MSNPPLARHHILLSLAAAIIASTSPSPSADLLPKVAAFANARYDRHHHRVTRTDDDAVAVTTRSRSPLPLATGRRGNFFSPSSSVVRLNAWWNWNANDDDDDATTTKAAVADVKLLIEEKIANTDRGRSMRDSDRPAIHSLLSDLESLCALSAPARDARMEGP